MLAGMHEASEVVEVHDAAVADQHHGTNLMGVPGSWRGSRPSGRDDGQIHAQSGQEGIRRIIAARSTLSCTDSPSECGKSRQCEVTQVKVALTDPDHVGTVTSVPTGPLQGS